MTITRASTLALAAFLVVGCTKDNPSNQQAPALTSEVTAKLEKADAQDGTVDKVVSNCAGCQLGMPGKAEYSAKLGDYTLHLCDHCKDKVKNPTPIISQLKIKE